MSDAGNTAQVSPDAGAGQAATENAGRGADAPVSALSAAAAADTKADAAKKADSAAGETKPAEGVPEVYELKMPEGMSLDAATLEAATPVFKELGLNAAQAQKLTDIYAGRMAAVVQQQRDAWAKQHEGWVSSMKADAEFGGDKFAGNVSAIASAIDKVMGDWSHGGTATSNTGDLGVTDRRTFRRRRGNGLITIIRPARRVACRCCRGRSRSAGRPRPGEHHGRTRRRHRGSSVLARAR